MLPWILVRVVETVRERAVVMFPWAASVEVIFQALVVIDAFLSSVVLVDMLWADSSRASVGLADRMRAAKGYSVVVLMDRLRAVTSLSSVMLADRGRAVGSFRAPEMANSLLMVVLVAKLLVRAVFLADRVRH